MRAAVVLVFLAMSAWVGGVVLLRHCIAKPPTLPTDTSVMRLKPESRDGKVWLGKSWAGRRDGLLVVYLKGSPFEMGYADGLLMQEQMHTLEDDFVKMIQGYVPRHWVMEVLKNYILYRNRHLSDYVPLDYRLEIYGESLGCPDIRSEEGPFYNRLLNYHAAHDVSYMMIDNPLVSRAGCTAFGAWGKATQDGHLITGRNFDWEAAEVFSRDRVVMMIEPDNAIPFISLAWAGMAGVVSGMNRAGVSVTINGAPSSLPGETATPVAIVAREILEKAHNLTEALAILNGAKVFVSTLWMIGSRADGKIIVVEKTPVSTQVREPAADTIICANHFETSGLSDAPRNTNYMAESTSVSRDTRLKNLVANGQGKINPTLAASILRDTKLPGDIFAGYGHRSALNALIATHATVMDLTDGIFWAASPPNQLGRFVAFDVQDFSRELPGKTVPADSILADGAYERACQAKRLVAAGNRALKAKDAQTALELAEQAEPLNPGFYQIAMLRGEALLALKRQAEAQTALKQALSEHPAFLKERQQIEKLLHPDSSAR